MERQLQALRSVLAGLAVGLVGNILFYGQVIGISFLFFVALATGILCLFTYKAMNRRNLWVIAPMLFFAVMIAVRSDTNILLLNGLAVVALFFLLVRYITLKHPLDTDTLTDYVASAIDAGTSSLRYAGGEYIKSGQWLHQQIGKDNTTVVAVGRGLLITVPVVLVFGLLLASADVVFSGYFDDLMTLVNTQFALDLVWRTVVLMGLGWVMTGSIAYALYVNPSDATYLVTGDDVQEIEKTDEPEKPKRKSMPFRLGIIEAGMMLGSLILLFGVFVFVQFTYLFGGQANISVEGFTYSEYARRGFFELSAVTVLMLALLLWLDSVTVVDGKRQTIVLRGLASVIVGLMLVIVLAASQRMVLYEEAYGFTHLRVYSHVFILWIGVLFIAFLLHLFRVRPNVFSLGVLLVMIGYLGTMNLLNVDRYIAEHNIIRYQNGEELDVCYLNQLSLDALPAILKVYRDTADASDTETQIIHDHATYWLALKHYNLEREQRYMTLFSTNLARNHAWAELDEMQLPDYWSLSSTVTDRCGYGMGSLWRG